MQRLIDHVREDGRRARPRKITEGRYTVRLAENLQELDEALKLRYRIFNLELGEGLASNHIFGRDEDEFDAKCEHLLAIESDSRNVIGTYRTQTIEAAGSDRGFYCANEFDLSTLPQEFLQNGMEIGRACIDIEHRHTKALFLLWKGLWQMALSKDKRYLFGCCSLTSTDMTDGIAAAAELEKLDAYHPDYWINPLRSHACRTDEIVTRPYKLPKLFTAYLRFGAKVISGSAIDREFGTIDFLVAFDLHNPTELARKMLSGEN